MLRALCSERFTHFEKGCSAVLLRPRAGLAGAPALYCPWPRCFVYHTIAFGAAFTLHCCALRGISGGATMTIPGGGAQHSVTRLFHFPDVLGTPASLIGSELSSLLGSGLCL